MRKTLIAVLFASTLPAIAMAMPDNGHRHHGGKHAPFAQLDLTQEQKREMRELMGEQMKSHREITQRYLDKLPEAERNAMQDELKTSKEKTHKEIRDLLKPEQQKKFDELHEKMEAKRAERAEFKQWKAERDQKS
ncbi:MAG TPA: LTXXQ domain protein [Pseudomonas sp.]|nr:LTXXQ domain protein [Pseudomonas sp.]